MPYADREVGNAYRRAYRKKHLEKFRQIEANSKKKNQWKYRERGRKYAAAWRKANPEKYKATVRRRAIKTRKPPKKPRIKIGDKFGFLIILEKLKNTGGHDRYTCLCICGKETNTWGSSLIRNNTKSCGCKNDKTHLKNALRIEAIKRRRRSGVDDNFILTPVNRIERMKFKKTIREKIIKRDGRKCRLCLSQKNGLYVHHIKPWCNHKELRFEHDNLITLCKTCHHLAHDGNTLKEPNQEMARKLTEILRAP